MLKTCLGFAEPGRWSFGRSVDFHYLALEAGKKPLAYAKFNGEPQNDLVTGLAEAVTSG